MQPLKINRGVKAPSISNRIEKTSADICGSAAFLKIFGIARKPLRLVVMVMTIGFCAQSYAAEYNDGDACASAGAYHRKNDATGTYYLVCDGSLWKQFFSFDISLGMISMGSGAHPINSSDFISIGRNVGAIVNGTKFGGLAIGHNALAQSNMNRNVAIGGYALNIIGGQNNTGVGVNAARFYNGSNNTFIGADVGDNAGGNMNDNIIVGYDSGSMVANNAANNVIIGSNAGNDAVDQLASNNILIGYDVEPQTTPSAASELNIGNVIFGDLTNAVHAGGAAYIGINEPAPSAALHVNGDIHFTGTLTDISDKRKKKHIRPLTGALEKFRNIRGVSFVMKDDPNSMRELGLIAQDVQPVYPEAVKTLADGTLALNYQGMVGPLVTAMNELNVRHTNQVRTLATLQSRTDALRRSVGALSRRIETFDETAHSRMMPYNQ